MMLPQNETHSSMEENRELRSEFTLIWNIYLWQREQEMQYNGEKTSSSIDGIGKLDNY